MLEKLSKSKPQAGLTLVELLVVLVILSSMIGIGIAGYNQFNERQRVKQSILNVKNDLRYIQNKATASEVPANCGILNGYTVTFNADNIHYSATAQCSNAGTYPVYSFALKTGLTFSARPNTITFQPLQNVTVINPAGNTTLTVQNPAASTYTQTLTINVNGEILGP